MSPVAEGRLVIAHVGGHDNGALTAFDMDTGEVKWAWKGDGPAYASPIVADLGGVRQVVTQSQKFLVGVSAANGELLWSIPFTTEYVQNIVTPVLYKEMLVFSGINKGVLAIRVLRHGDKWTPEKVWENPEVSFYMNTPVVHGDLLLGLSHRNKGQFVWLDARTGEKRWAGEGRQGENAAVVKGGDSFFLLTTDSELIVGRMSGKGFEPLHRYTVATSPTWAHPVIVNRGIVIKDAENLTFWSWN
jgi:outer membrane protein assembly factor BamB